MLLELLGVKNGMSEEEVASSGTDRLAVKPIDCEGIMRLCCIDRSEDRLTPLVTRRRTMFSRPTNAPLRMKRTFEVSTAYESGQSDGSGTNQAEPLE